MTSNGSGSTTPGRPSGQFAIHGDPDTMPCGKADNGVDAVLHHHLQNLHLDPHQELTHKQGAANEASSKRENVVPLTTSKLANTSASGFYSGPNKKFGHAESQPNPESGTTIRLLQSLGPNNNNVKGKNLFNDPNSSVSQAKADDASAPMQYFGGPSKGFKPSESPEADKENTEVEHLKKMLESAHCKLESANSKITHLEQSAGSSQGSPSRNIAGMQHTMNNVQDIHPGQLAASYAPKQQHAYGGKLSPQPTDSYNGVWNQNSGAPYMGGAANSAGPSAWNPPNMSAQGPSNYPRFAPQPQRPNNILLESFNQGYDPAYRRGSGQNRAGSGMGPFGNGWNNNSYPASVTSSTGISPPMTPGPYQGMRGGLTPAPLYQQRSMGAPLSPMATDFNSDNVTHSSHGVTNPWNAQPGNIDNPGSTYVSPVEPINYRRLLDKNMNCDWKYIVDKIVCNNEQQASIFLQQKLKVATPEQKFELVEAIINQAYPLMINRFGNFLIQRCLEHGTPEQVDAIAETIRGNTLNLSMDAFGCHVIQKAFDVVPEHYKAIMVHELLRQIPQTVIHRYACHVWQKLFELRWSDSPPQIMKFVNESLRGMWHEVALGETGSLVVQNIFENCLEEDKRPCIDEVLASIDMVAHGQFGNWCIQHICEHGAPADKSRATEHVLRFASEYSMDQFASKVVEKCLRIGGNDFLDRYLEKVSEGRPDRPRMPLIDIAGDQYGNYLIQYILLNADGPRRELVAQQIRKHMVSLRGSKFGSKVAMLCCNPASTTRPGPPTVMPMNDRFFQNSAIGMGRQGFPGPPQYR